MQGLAAGRPAEIQQIPAILHGVADEMISTEHANAESAPVHIDTGHKLDKGLAKEVKQLLDGCVKVLIRHRIVLQLEVALQHGNSRSQEDRNNSNISACTGIGQFTTSP